MPSSLAAIRNVAVIGAGTAGREFALTCAAAGFQVVLEDVMPARLRRAEVEYADLTRRSGAGRLTPALTVEDAVREADLAIDFVPDELESKLEIFSMIDRMAPPKTILCTPSDVLSITDLASCVYRPERCVAVRGTLAPGAAIRLLHTAGTTEPVLIALEEFMRTLGIDCEREADADAPMLVKNQSRAAVVSD